MRKLNLCCMHMPTCISYAHHVFIISRLSWLTVQSTYGGHVNLELFACWVIFRGFCCLLLMFSSKLFFFQNVLSWIPCQTVKLDAQSNGLLFMTPRCLNCLVTSYDQAYGVDILHMPFSATQRNCILVLPEHIATVIHCVREQRRRLQDCAISPKFHELAHFECFPMT